MRLIQFFIFSILICCHNSFAQDCGKEFIESIEASFNRCEKRFEKMASRSIMDSKVSASEFIYLPVVFSKRLKSRNNLESSKLLCYLNADKLEFDEVIVEYDSVLMGVLYFWSSKKIEYIQSEDAKGFIQPLFERILEIDPDFIFSVYNLPEVYWYVKDDQLYALSYTHEDKAMSNFRILTAEDYIKTSVKEEQLMFLSPKRVKVVSGK